MDTKDLRGLMEAYSEVYAPQEVDEATAMAKRGYDETKLRKRAGGGEAADRATALENKPTYGNTSKTQQRQRYARAQRGDFRNTASSSPGLHGYGHQSNDPKVKAKQAARGAQRGALTPAEKKQLNMEMEYDVFDMVMEFLYVEGYAETLEEAEWMMANLIDEEAIDILLGEEEQLQELSNRKLRAYVKKSEKSHQDLNKKWDQGTASYMDKYKSINRERGQERALKKLNNEAFEAWLDEAMTNYEKNRKRAAQRAAARNAARDQGKTGVVPGVGYVTPRRERETWTDESGKTRHAKGL